MIICEGCGKSFNERIWNKCPTCCSDAGSVVGDNMTETQTKFHIGDRIEHNIYGLGFVSSRSKMGGDAFFISFDRRKDMLWIESSNIKKVKI